MPLRDLQKSLYDPRSSIQEDRKRINAYDPLKGEFAFEEKFRQGKSATEEERKNARYFRKKVFLIGGIALFVLAIGGWGAVQFIRYQRTAFSPERVTISVQSLDRMESNSNVLFTFHVKNDNRVTLHNTAVRVRFPQFFIPEERNDFKRDGLEVGTIELGEISAYSQKDIQFSGKFMGVRSGNISMRADFSYTPEKLSTLFSASDQKTVHIESSALVIDVQAPIEIAQGDEAEYAIRYTNTRGEAYYGMKMQIEYPKGFRVTYSNPQVSEGNNIWYLGAIDSGQSGTVHVKGYFDASENEKEVPIAISIGTNQEDGTFSAYAQSQVKTKIVTPPLSVKQVLNKEHDIKIYAGNVIWVEIAYRNDGKTALRNVVIEQKLNGKIFDFSKMDIEKGAVNVSKQTITWRAADIPELALLNPGDYGNIRYSLKTLGAIPVLSPNDKNFLSSLVTTIDSPDIPDKIGARRIVGTDRSEILLNSDIVSLVDLVDTGTRQTVRLPQVSIGRESVFEVHWKVSNLYNDVSDTIAILSVPSGVTWKGLITAGENAVWNERTQQITWNIGKISSSTGILVAPRELVFLVSVVPQINQANAFINILQNIEVNARDEFTSEHLKDVLDPVQVQAN